MGKTSNISRAKRDQTARHDAFSALCKESAYWIGFLLADGCVTDTGGRQLVVSLKAADRGHLEKLKAFLGSTNAIQEFDAAAGNGKVYPTCRFAIRSQELINDLAEWGIVPRKSQRESPHADLVADRDFWRGVVDGDGYLGLSKSKTSVILQPKFELVGSEELVKAFASFAKAALDVDLTPRKKRSVWSVACSANPALKIVKALYKDADVYLDRKYGLAQQVSLGFKKGATSKSTWKRMESDVAKALSKVFGTLIHRVPLSGINSRHNRGDAIVPDGLNFLVECKLKQKFAHHAIYEKARQDAILDGKDPDHVFLFTTVKGTGETLVVISDRLFYKFLEMPGATDLFRKIP